MATSYDASNNVDVYSASAPGQINLFNQAGTFAIQLQSPASITGSTTPLSIPNVAGVNGNFLQLTSNQQLGWTAWAVNSSTSCPYNTRYYSSSTNVCTTVSAAFVVADYYFFLGSTALGGNPTQINAILGFVAPAITIVVQIIDITTSPFTNVVAAVTVTSAAIGAANTPTFVNMTITPANIAAGNVIWKIQVQRSVGAGTVQFYGLQIIG